MNTKYYTKARSLLIVFVLTLTMSCEKIDNSSYLDKWVSVYAGTSHHWGNYPVSMDSFVRTQKYKHVLAEVGKGDFDSTLNLTLIFDSITTITHIDLKFSDSGNHFSDSGGGSSYASLDIYFIADSLYYKSFNKCGIPCSVGVDFSIKKEQ